MKLKRVFAALLCIVVLLSFSSCNREEKQSDETGEIVADRESPFYELRSMLDMLNVTEPVVPTWIPEGFEKREIDLHNYSGFNCSTAVFYENGERNLGISVCLAVNGSSPSYFVDENSVTEYVSNGITHYLATLGDIQTAMWTNGYVYVDVFGNITREELCKIVDSVYEDVPN